MGSLMSGWDSPTLGRNQVLRARSFTKEEIDGFWNKKKNEEEEHRKAALDLAMNLHKNNTQQKKTTIDGNRGEASQVLSSIEDELESLSSYRDWWTKSSWAFLNDSKMEREALNSKYASQFNVASSQTTAMAQ